MEEDKGKNATKTWLYTQGNEQWKMIIKKAGAKEQEALQRKKPHALALSSFLEQPP